MDKQPGVIPIRIGEILRRVTGKIVMKLLKRDVLKATGFLQLCARQDAAVKRLFMPFMKCSIKKAEVIVDASNAFNTINPEALLHNTKILCPSISTYIKGCYSSRTDLYIQSGRSIKSEEGTTQGNPTAMAIYALGITRLLAWLSKK